MLQHTCTSNHAETERQNLQIISDLKLTSNDTCSAPIILYSKRVVSQNPRISFKIITSSTAGTKMHKKSAAPNVLHYIPSKLLVIFSKSTIFKKNIIILKICRQSALKWQNCSMMKFSRVMRYEYKHFNNSKSVDLLVL